MAKYPIYDVQHFSCDSVKGELYVNTFAEHLRTHHFVEERHRHNSYLLVFFTNGSGVHEIDFDSFSIRPGSLFVMHPGQLHYWSLSEDIEGFIIIYSQEIYDLYFSSKKINDYPFYYAAGNRPEIYFPEENAKALLPYFTAIIAESRQKESYAKDKILNLLDCIHIEIARKYTGTEMQTAHAYNARIRNLELLIEQHFRSQKLPSFYASRLNITLKHLNRITNEILQKTATVVITERVMLEAKRMLADRQLSVSEIANALGYEDMSYFSRIFKKNVGVSPKAFRNPEN